MEDTQVEDVQYTLVHDQARTISYSDGLGPGKKDSLDTEQRMGLHDEQLLRKKHKRYRIRKGILLQFPWLAVGFYVSLSGPALPDLRDNLGVTTEQVMRSLACIHFGYFVGGMSGGLLHDRFAAWRDVIFAFSQMLAGIMTTFVPLATSLWILGIVCFLIGVGEGGTESVGDALSFGLMGKKADSLVHATHFVLMLGMFLGPLFMGQFISSRRAESGWSSNSSAGYFNASLLPSSSTTAVPVGPSDTLYIPFTTLGVVTFVIGMTFVGAYLRGPPEGLEGHTKEKSSLREVFSLGSCADGHVVFSLLMITLLTLEFVLLMGIVSYGKLLYTFATESATLRFSSDEAVLLVAVNYGMLIAARLVTLLLSPWVPVQVLLFVQISGLVISTSCMYTFGTRNKIAFWALNCTSGFFVGPVWPTLYIWASKYITMYSMVISLNMLGAGTAGFFFEWLYGHVYTYYPPQTLFIIPLACSGCFALVLIIMQIIALRHVRRKNSNNNNDEMNPCNATEMLAIDDSESNGERESKQQLETSFTQ